MKPFRSYLPIDDTLFNAPLYLTSAGRAVLLPGSAYPPPGHPDLYQFQWREGRVLPEFSLVWIEQGSGFWETHEGSHRIQSGQVGQIFAGQWHRYRPDPKTGWTESWVQFNGRWAHELEQSGLFCRKEPIRTPVHPTRFARQLQEFLKDITSPDFINSASTGLRLAGLLGLLERPGKIPSFPSSSLIEKARSHIWSHSHRQLNVPEVARYLGVSRRTLERAFTAEGKTTVLDEITRCRLNRAERLLRETRLPVQDVVSLAGFGTPEQMRLHFQERHGKSPWEFRKSPSPK